MTTNNSPRAMPGKRVLLCVLGAIALTCVHVASAAIDPDQSRVPSPAGDGWQVLGAGNGVKTATATGSASQAGSTAPAVVGSLAAGTALSASTDVKTVVLPGPGTAPPSTLSLSITPQDVNLRNALDRWVQTQGWQLAWSIGDDLPVEFNASFSGDFDGLLDQVMRATNHMRTPARVCEHTNNVVRVIARAANCKD